MSSLGEFSLGFAGQGWSIPHLQIALVVAVIGLVILLGWQKPKIGYANNVLSYGKFFYANILKPHSPTSGEGQRQALEGFYKTQVLLW